MSINPFDDDNGSFFPLVNDEEQQHSLVADLRRYSSRPAGGWFYGEADRAACLDYIEQNWANIRPENLSDRPAAGRPLMSKPCGFAESLEKLDGVR